MAGFSVFSDLINPTKYNVPNAPYVDPGAAQLDTIAGNTSAFAGAKDLAASYNDFMAQQQAKQLKTSMPWLQGLETQGAQTIADRLAGKLSTSDAAAAQRSSAARALGLGTNVGATTLRDLGLTQYQAQSSGLAALPGFAQSSAAIHRTPLFDFSNVFLNPAQRWQMNYQNATNQWNVQNLKAQMAAQPDPWMKSLAGLGDSLLTTAGGAFTMGYFGGMGQNAAGAGASARQPFTMQQYNMMNQNTGFDQSRVGGPGMFGF